MDLDEIKRGLRAEIKKRENEQYLTFQCNVRQMCKDVLAKLEEQESVIAELKSDYEEVCGRLQTANLIKDEQLAEALATFYQACYCQWYHYTIRVDGKTKIVGEYTLRNQKRVFVLTKKDGTEKVWEI